MSEAPRITLDYLSPLAAELAEVMWSIESEQEFDAWYSGLPRRLKCTVDSLKVLMVLEVLEPLLTTDVDSATIAQEFIKKVRQG